jgi:hypothetical protein
MLRSCVGLHGYMYCLSRVGDVNIARMVECLVIPDTIDNVDNAFKNTILAFYKWKVVKYFPAFKFISFIFK